mmetsp:Transcript_96325/g.274474  ORF Transcript_96325/g.274474 Transcript_96325/m.274474 type:complete len:398 (-) Transcript_96325:604-1797(-)
MDHDHLGGCDDVRFRIQSSQGLLLLLHTCVDDRSVNQRTAVVFRAGDFIPIHAPLHHHSHTHINQPRAVLVIDMGRLIKDVESVVVAFDSTDGVYMTTAEDVALANTTNDSPFMVTRHVYLRSTGSTRISFATIYLIYFFVKSMTAPEECLILKDAPGRTVGVREEEQPDNACQEATLSGPNAEEQTPVGEQAQPARRTLIRLNAIDEANETFAYDDVELDNESREDVEMLRDEEEAVVLMPADEYVICHGPERTVLYFFCRNLWLTEKINNAFEGIKLVSTLLLLTMLVGVAATAKLIPFELRWVAALGMLDPIRKVFKMNWEACGLVLRELDFHIPFWANIVAAYFASSSLDHEPGFLIALIAYALMVSVVLLGKSPTTRPPYAIPSTSFVTHTP